MYGFALQSEAEYRAAKLRAAYPHNQYKVQPHSWSIHNTPLTWGVVRYVPYCEEIPWKNDGFVWFPRNARTLGIIG